MKKTLLALFRCTLAGTLLTTSAWAGQQQYEIGSRQDPALRASDFDNAIGQHLTATTELLRIQDDAPAGTTLPSDHTWRLSESLLDFGLREEARKQYRELSLVTTDYTALGKARLRMAEFLYQRGFPDEAADELFAIRDQLPSNLLDEWQDLLSRTLMVQGKYGDAVEVITELKNPEKQSAYTRFNLGVGLINDGRVDQGRTVLDRLGQMRVSDPEMLALRDKTNLILGYNFLQAQQGGSARPILARIRLEGPFSNRALLGLGWSELSQQGVKQPKVNLGDEPKEPNPLAGLATLGVLLNPAILERDVYKRAGLRDFKIDPKKVNAAEELNLRRALIAWVELINRDPMDPAVQEGMLAIPFALERLGAHQQAAQYYEKAIDLLEETRRRLDEASKQVQAGRMVETIVRRDLDSEAGWEWRLKDLPDAPETFYLQTVIAEHRFQEALKNYRDVRLLGRILDGWRLRLNSLQAEIDRNPAAAVSAQTLTALAKKKNQKPEKLTEPVFLTLDTALRPRTRAKAPYVEVPTLNLKLSESVPKFDGVPDRIVALYAQIEALRPKVGQAGTDQGKKLETIALQELSRQKRQVTKYLIEARFALARAYDQDPALREERQKAEKAASEKAAKEGKKGLFGSLFE